MGSRIFYSIKTHFHVVHFDFICDHTFRVVSFFCSFLFGLLSRRFFRNKESRNLYENESISDEISHRQHENKICSSCSSHSEIEEQSISSSSSSRYDYWSEKGISKFLEEPTTLSFRVYDPNLGSYFSGLVPVFDMQKVELDPSETEDSFQRNMADKDDDDEVVVNLEEEEEPKFIVEIISDGEGSIIDNGIVSSDKDFRNYEYETEKTEDSVESSVIDYVLEETDDLDKASKPSNEVQSLPECVAEEVSVCSRDVSLTDSTNNGVSGVGILDQEPKPETIVFEEKQYDNREMETTDSDEEYIELHLNKHNPLLFEDEEETSSSDENQGSRESFDEKISEKSEDSCCFYEEDFEVENEADDLVEHEDLIHQLKMELKLARTGGLPTILEESESEELETPKSIIQQLKPMKIDDHKPDYKHILEGIRKVYRNYSDKMRKLDILNFQTMHALGLLEIQGTVDFQRARKSCSVPAIVSLLSQNLWPCKGSAVIEPMRKVIDDMDRDFESVYIGQLCLSWEMLHWQYTKALELQSSVPKGSHCFNQVAGGFQLFQVLVQRFLENEQFQGPRIKNYINNRCVLRDLLQIPLLKDDSSKDKGKRGNESRENATTSQMLAAIIEQSMKIFWDFVRTDREETNALFQSHVNSRSILEEPVDLELLTDVRNDHQKKEKRLKDILRRGKCIAKRLKKRREEDKGVHQTLLIAQVELKLVAKVLNMSNLTTDKLIWCHEKLEKINMCHRKVVVESSFLLFPC